jgi:hypothetical protein
MIEIVENREKDKQRRKISQPIKNHKKPNSKNYFLVYLVISLMFILGLFFANWANQPKGEKEILYQNLLNRQNEGILSEDSISILCKLAKELKKEIPKICTEKKYSFAKKSGKNEKHKNKKAKESAEEKMIFWKNQKDSLFKIVDKTKEVKSQYDKAEKQYEHWKRKAHQSGENHSQSTKR